MMARSGAFGKRGKFLGAGIAVLAVLSLLLYYGVASGTDFVRTDRLWSFEASAKILVLGLSIAVIVYLGISLLKNRLSLRRYTLLAWSWFVVFFLFAGLFAIAFPGLSAGVWVESFVFGPIPRMVWASILMAALGGFLQMAAGRQNRAGARRFHTLPVPTGAGRISGWFAAASLAGVLAEGACRVLYFMGNQAVISHQDMAFASVGFQCGDISGRRVSGPVKMAACGPGCPSFLWKDAALNLFGGERPVFCDFVDGSSCLSMDA